MEERRKRWEDHLLERKTDRDVREIRKTAVAFANSVRPGHIATILIGEENDGKASGLSNPDEFQKKIRNELEKIYPDIVWRQAVYEKEGKSCIRVEIEYSGETPHFGDIAWIRRGSETVKASDEMFQKLIDLRTSKTRELTLWLGKEITLSWNAASNLTITPNWTKLAGKVIEVTGHFATFQLETAKRSEPLSWLDLSWDDENSRLRIFVNPQMSRWS